MHTYIVYIISMASNKLLILLFPCFLLESFLFVSFLLPSPNGARAIAPHTLLPVSTVFLFSHRHTSSDGRRSTIVNVPQI